MFPPAARSPQAPARALRGGASRPASQQQVACHRQRRWAQLGFLPPEGSILGARGLLNGAGVPSVALSPPITVEPTGPSEKAEQAWICRMLRPQHEKGMVGEEPGPSGGLLGVTDT